MQATSTNDTPEILNIEFHVRILVVKAMNKYQGNYYKAAQALFVSKRTLYRYVNDFGIEQHSNGIFYIPGEGRVVPFLKTA